MPTTNLPTISEEIQLPEWIKTPEQNALYLASGKVKVRDFNTTDQLAELTDFMKWWRMQLGITVSANHIEPQMNIIHINELYSDLSIEDLKLAVKYSFSGILDVDFIAYNSFSPLYISKILNSYKQFRDDQLNAIARAKMKFDIDQQKQKGVKTESEIELLNRKARHENYLLIKNSDSLVTVLPGVWNMAVSKNWVDANLLTDELLRSTIEKQLGKVNGSPVENPVYRTVNEDEVNRYIKYRLLKDYFTINEVDFLTIK
jgi:hypothetical protein